MQTTGSSGPPATALHLQPDIHARRWKLLGVMCLSLVMVVMAVSGLNVAIPSIQRDLDASSTDLQWIVDSYAIVFAGLLLTAGALGDRFGRKRALLAGLATFGLGSLLGAIAASSEGVIVARSVMGIGAAFVMPATLSLISAIFPPEERSRAIAMWAGFAGAGGAIGPVIVGFLLTGWWVVPALWWGSAFLVNVVAVAVVIAAVAVWSPESSDDEATPLDPVGAALSLVGLAALLFAIIEGPSKGWSSTVVVSSFVVAAVALVGFVVWERRAVHPMLPMELFRRPRFSVGSAVIALAFMVMFGFFFLAAMYLQFVRDYSPLAAGFATLPLAFALVLVSPRSAALAERFGLSAVIASGFGLITAGMVVMSTLDTDTPYLTFAGGLVLLGAGMGVTAAPATGAIMGAVPLNKAGVGSAMNDTTREVGGALGIALLGSLAASAYRSEVDVSQLPAEAAGPAAESIGGAMQVAAEIGGPEGAALANDAASAFVDAFSTTAVIGAVIAAVLGVALLASRRIVAADLGTGELAAGALALDLDLDADAAALGRDEEVAVT